MKHKAFKNALKEKKCKSKELAEYVGTTPSMVSHWLNLRAKPAEKHHAKIEERLGVSVNELWPYDFVNKMNGAAYPSKPSTTECFYGRDKDDIQFSQAALDPALIYEEKERQENVSLILEDLTPQQRKAILYRFSFIEDGPRTLGAVGKKLDVCRTRVRQIEFQVVHTSRKKLRNRPEFAFLSSYRCN